MKKILLISILLSMSFFVSACDDNTETTDKLNFCTTGEGEKRIVCHASNYKAKEVIIPETTEINGTTYEVDGIANNAFQNNPYIEKVIVPANITRVGIYSFENCSSLKEVTFEGEGLTYLSSSMFENTPNLKNVTLPSNLEIINSSCFKNSGIETLILPDTVTKINARTFESSKLQNITLNNLTLGEYAFSDCHDLKMVSISNVEEIPYKCFYNAFNLETLNIYNVKTIGSYAFYQLSKLQSLSFDSNIREINDSAFRGCNSLKNLTFEEGIKRIGVHTFDNAPLESLFIPNGEVEIQSYAFTNGSLKEVSITEETIYNSKSFPESSNIAIR